MGSKTLYGYYGSGYSLSPSNYLLKIASGATVAGAGVSASQVSTIINYGSIDGSTDGVLLVGGGAVFIDAGSTIFGGQRGVSAGRSSFVANYGTIVGLQAGVYLGRGGAVVNGALG